MCFASLWMVCEIVNGVHGLTTRIMSIIEEIFIVSGVKSGKKNGNGTSLTSLDDGDNKL